MGDIGYVTSLTTRVRGLRASGVSAYALRTSAWADAGHGLFRPAGISEEQPGLRIADAIGLLTPGCALGGWASRWLQGQSYCDGAGHGAREQPVTILCGPGAQLRRRPGIRPRERLVLPGELVELDGVTMTTIARSTYDDMLDAAGPVEALVCLEMATSTTVGQSRTALSNVQAVYDAHHKTRGRSQAGWALDHASTRSASPWETRTRELAIEVLGISDWLVNPPVFDLSGNLLGVPDLLDEATGLVLECDGEGHRAEERHNDDNVREECFEEHGMTVVRVGVRQLSRPGRSETDRRLRAGHVAARESAVRRRWTLEKPAWWHSWPSGRRWD